MEVTLDRICKPISDYDILKCCPALRTSIVINKIVMTYLPFHLASIPWLSVSIRQEYLHHCRCPPEEPFDPDFCALVDPFLECQDFVRSSDCDVNEICCKVGPCGGTKCFPGASTTSPSPKAKTWVIWHVFSYYFNSLTLLLHAYKYSLSTQRGTLMMLQLFDVWFCGSTTDSIFLNG